MLVRPFDATGAFRPNEVWVPDQLRRVTVGAAGVTLLSGSFGLGVQIVSTMLLARLLRPGDFGLIAMVTTFSLLLSNFGLNGFTEAIIQKDEINNLLVSNLFWINVGVGLVLSIALAFVGSLLARFYGDRRVAYVAIGMSPTIFIISLSVHHLALLKRAMRFPSVSANDLIARLSSTVVSILLSWRGWGYWALIAGAITLALSQTIGAWSLCRWIPSLPHRTDGTAATARFAMNVYARFSVNYTTRNMDNLLVGWRFNAHALGFYKKAYDLFALPANQLVVSIATVAISALSRLNRDQVRYSRWFLRSLSVLAFVGMGISAVLTLVGKDLIRVLLGPGWDEAGRIFTFFAPGIGVMLIYYTNSWIHLSIGAANRWLRWGLVEVTVTGLLFLGALRWGPAGIAIAWTISFWLLIIPAFWYAGRPIQFSLGPVLNTIWRYVVASFAAACIAAGAVREVFGFMEPSSLSGVLFHFFITSLSFFVLYIGAVILLHGGFEPLRQVAGLLPDMILWTRSVRHRRPISGGMDDALTEPAGR